MSSKIVFISELCNKQLVNILIQYAKVIFVKKNSRVYPAIASHPDIQLFCDNKVVFIDKGCFNDLHENDQEYLLNINVAHKINKFSKYDEENKRHAIINVIESNLGNRYPVSVPFNGKFYKNTFIHHLDYTHPLILNYIKGEAYNLIHTNQGYSGCSLMLFGEKCGITADKGLYKQLIQEGYNILLINDELIRLEGLDHGFFGGCCGVIGKDVIINGDLDLYPEGDLIRKFIMNQDYRVQEVKGYELTDIGSIIFMEV